MRRSWRRRWVEDSRFGFYCEGGDCAIPPKQSLDGAPLFVVRRASLLLLSCYSPVKGLVSGALMVVGSVGCFASASGAERAEGFGDLPSRSSAVNVLKIRLGSPGSR